MIDLEYTENGEYAVITVHQHLTAVGIADIKRFIGEIVTRPTQLIILDMCKVYKLSTAGIGMIYTVNNRVRESGRHIALLLNDEARAILMEKSDISKLLIAPNHSKARLMLRSAGFQARGSSK